MDFVELIKNLGLTEKAARVYLASLEMGEATVQDLARRAVLKRTTVYYVLRELQEFGAVITTKRNKKQYYIPEEPKNMLKRARERIADVEDSLTVLEERKHAVYHRPRVLFLYGPTGFKQVWNLIFASSEKGYLIVTSGESFLDFVREKYVIEEIIKTKRERGFSSRQMIIDSPYARKIIAKDLRENRVSKLLPSRYKLPFTEVICGDIVAFISPPADNLIMIIENASFAKTRRSAFEILWNTLPAVSSGTGNYSGRKESQ
ncbi:MAG: hypothetical protein HYT41_01260 [Candidatus Sungbacteria bacterium]|nr:hypothetical protein [Candidatus Sungbacteria bacterium]